jgi:hypothetical protein
VKVISFKKNKKQMVTKEPDGGDTPANNLTFTNKFLYEVTHFYKKKWGSHLQ